MTSDLSRETTVEETIDILSRLAMTPMPCSYCHGAGEMRDNPGYPDPQCEVSYTCPRCAGTGDEPREPAYP